MTTSTEQIEHLVEDIRVRLVENRYDDPGLANDLLAYVMRELSELAVEGNNCEDCYVRCSCGDHAAEVLAAMQSRAVAGGWPAPPEYPYEHVLGPDDLDPREG